MRTTASERERGRVQEPRVTLDLDGFLRRMLGGPALETQTEFIKSQEPYRAFMGRAGEAKTSSGCAAILSRALLRPGYRACVGRYDYNDLVGTTQRRLVEMLERLPSGLIVERNKSPPEIWKLRPVVAGALSEIMFLGLKEHPGSYEFHGIFVDEADECELGVVETLRLRLRAPPPEGVSEEQVQRELLLTFNPPDKHHWLYTACTGKDFQDKVIDEAWLSLFKPRGKENLVNLPTDYYEKAARGMSEDRKQRFIEGEWGSTFDGQPVYREFSARTHVRDLAFDEDLTLLRFWDFGYRRPACIFCQLDAEGRLLVLAEILGENEELVPFVRKVKAFTATRFPGAGECCDYGDPAVRQKKDTGNALALLHEESIVMMFRTSKIEEGVRTVRLALEQLVRGEPALQFDRMNCQILIAAMRGGYRLDATGQKPVKDGYYDHLADAFRYGVLNVFDGGGRASGTLPKPFAVASRQVPDSVEYSSAHDHALPTPN